MAPCAWSVSSRSCASRSRLATVTGSAGACRRERPSFPSRPRGLGLELVIGALDRALDELAVQRAVDDDRPALLELDQHAGGARLVDVGVGEPDLRRAVGVAVELLVQLLRLGVELLGLLAQSQLGDLVRAGAVQVGGEHLAVAGVRERGVEHPARLAGEPLGGPGVAVVEVGDDGVEQVGGDGADRAQLVDGGQVDDVVADQLLGALGQLEDLHARGHAVLGPAERLRGAVLGQAAVEHRLDGLGLLVGVELLARDLCRPRGYADIAVKVRASCGIRARRGLHDRRALSSFGRMRRLSISRVEGVLAPYASGFRSWLTERGYRPSTVEDQVWLMAHLSRWLDEQGMEPAAFTDEAAEHFQRARRERYSHLTGSRALRPLLGYLRGLGLVPEPLASQSPAEAIMAAYREYLLRERGLVEGSVVLRARVARLFLGELSDPIEAALAQLRPGDVTRFVVAQCGDGRRGTAWASTLVSGLRSLLVFLHVTGRVPVPLAAAVPSVASWRLSSLPRGLDRDHVERILASCDRATAVGRRDYAILMLLSRLGLRACEIAALTLR